MYTISITAQKTSKYPETTAERVLEILAFHCKRYIDGKIKNQAHTTFFDGVTIQAPLFQQTYKEIIEAMGQEGIQYSEQTTIQFDVNGKNIGTIVLVPRDGIAKLSLSLSETMKPKGQEVIHRFAQMYNDDPEIPQPSAPKTLKEGEIRVEGTAKKIPETAEDVIYSTITYYCKRYISGGIKEHKKYTFAADGTIEILLSQHVFNEIISLMEKAGVEDNTIWFELYVNNKHIGKIMVVEQLNKYSWHNKLRLHLTNEMKPKEQAVIQRFAEMAV